MLALGTKEGRGHLNAKALPVGHPCLDVSESAAHLPQASLASLASCLWRSPDVAGCRSEIQPENISSLACVPTGRGDAVCGSRPPFWLKIKYESSSGLW